MVSDSYRNAKRTCGKGCEPTRPPPGYIEQLQVSGKALRRDRRRVLLARKKAYVLVEETKMAKLSSLSTCDQLYTTVGCSGVQSLVSFSAGPHMPVTACLPERSVCFPASPMWDVTTRSGHLNVSASPHLSYRSFTFDRLFK